MSELSTFSGIDQQAQQIRKFRLQDRFLHEDIIPVVFVPLLGKNGWTRDDASGMDG